jgi:tetratricopeptide (TPR) repeat protein
MRKVLFVMLLFVQSAWAITPEEKAKIVEGVYNKVYSAMGLVEEKPKFLFDTKQAARIAYMMKNKDGYPMIGFEEKAFDVCATMGTRRDDAIAYLIGHEVSHHHLYHHWGNEFSTSFSIANLGKEIKDIDKDGVKRFETQADERGGIYCYLAGYNVSGISGKLLTDLYKAYELQDSPKYPTLQERIIIAQKQDSIVSSYIKVFEAGNYSMLLKEYDVAIQCYEFVSGIKRFPSREIHNNLGVAYFLKGIEEAGDDISFIYPVEIDLESRIRGGGSKGMGDAAIQLFEKAKANFEKATLFDKTYSSGYLNLACAQIILNIYDEAEISLKYATKYAKSEGRKNTEDNIKLVLALMNHQNPEGDKALTESLLTELIAKGHDLAIYNKNIISGGDIASIKSKGQPIGWTDEDLASAASTQSARAQVERIEGIRDFENLEATKEEILYSRSNSLLCGLRDSSTIMMINAKSGEGIIFHSTKANYVGKMVKGTKVGSTERQLIEAYGLPEVIMASRQGHIYLYPKNKMMVFLNQEKCIDKWVLYTIN